MNESEVSTTNDTKFNGDINVAGRATFNSECIIKGDVKVEGNIEAANVARCDKGAFPSEPVLKQTYPRPLEGWYAIVGEKFPMQLYMVIGGEWKQTGESVEGPTVSITDVDKTISDLKAKVEGHAAEIANLKATNEMLKGKILRELKVAYLNSVSLAIRGVFEDDTRTGLCIIANAQGGKAGVMPYDDCTSLGYWRETMQRAGGGPFTPAVLEEDGKLPKSVLPEDVLNSVNFANTMFRSLWNAAVQEDGRGYIRINMVGTDKGSETGEYVANGYSNSGYLGRDNVRRYFLNGYGFTYEEAMRIYADRFLLGTGGMQLSSLANIPAGAGLVDSNVDLSFCVANNHTPVCINLGKDGWESELTPASMHRAFHDCPQLESIVGVLNLSKIKTDYDAYGMFRVADSYGEGSLRRLLIKGVPRTIGVLDLETCSPAIADEFTYEVKTDTNEDGFESVTTTPLEYLALHFKDGLDEEGKWKDSDRFFVKLHPYAFDKIVARMNTPITQISLELKTALHQVTWVKPYLLGDGSLTYMSASGSDYPQLAENNMMGDLSILDGEVE